MLKERVLKALSEDNCLFEPYFTVSETGSLLTPLQFNLAGLICRAAGFTPQGNHGDARLPLNAPIVEKKWLEFERLMSEGTNPTRRERELEVFAFARQLWAEEYGDESARGLPFYDKNQQVLGTCWWDCLSEVMTEDIVTILSDGFTMKINTKSF